jgi:hypothetical protein
LRRYGEFVDCIDTLKEFYPDFLAKLPKYPTKNEFNDLDGVMVESMKLKLNLFLKCVCDNNALVRCLEFVRFIDPKTNPPLRVIKDDQIVRKGTVKFKKSDATRMKSFFCVLTKRKMLYCFHNDKDVNMEPFLSLVLELCHIDLEDDNTISIFPFAGEC